MDDWMLFVTLSWENGWTFFMRFDMLTKQIKQLNIQIKKKYSPSS